MCGRFALFSSAGVVASEFGLAAQAEFRSSYNVAPGQEIITIHSSQDLPTGDFCRWGLVPFWARDPAIGNRMINARAETVTEKPSFRQSFRRRRCLIPADGFYEWHKAASGKQPRKQPIYISAEDASLLAFAGLWDEWRGDEEPLRSCTIITLPASPFMSQWHQRMPLILGAEDRKIWLDENATEAQLQGLLVREPATRLTAWEVSTRVNTPVNDSPDLITPLT